MPFVVNLASLQIPGTVQRLATFHLGGELLRLVALTTGDGVVLGKKQLPFAEFVLFPRFTCDDIFTTTVGKQRDAGGVGKVRCISISIHLLLFVSKRLNTCVCLLDAPFLAGAKTRG